MALAVLDDLWSRREERRPVLLVIDEAHNLCRRRTVDTLLLRAARDRLIQTAGGFVATPSIVQVGARITREGGIDVPVPMP